MLETKTNQILFLFLLLTVVSLTVRRPENETCQSKLKLIEDDINGETNGTLDRETNQMILSSLCSYSTANAITWCTYIERRSHAV